MSASAACSAAPSAYASPIPTAPSSEYGSDDEDSDDEDDERDEVSKQMRKKRLMEKKRKSFKVPPNVVFMRLKERCFVNNNEGRDLSEASFDGRFKSITRGYILEVAKLMLSFCRILLHCCRAKSCSRSTSIEHLKDRSFRIQSNEYAKPAQSSISFRSDNSQTFWTFPHSK